MLDPIIIGQILWTSLATSSYAVLFAVAFALVLKVNRVFNFTQGAVMMTAFYSAYSAVQLASLPGWVAFACACAAALVLSYAIERWGFAILRAKKASTLFVFIFSFVISLLGSYIVTLIFGTWSYTVFPSMFWPVFLVGGLAVSQWDLAAIATAILCVGALLLFLRVSRWGQFMLAVSDNPDLAELYGIEKGRVFMLAMLVAGALAAVGMLVFGLRAQVQPRSAMELMIFATVATMIGGIGSLAGAAAAAIGLAVIQNMSVLVIPSAWQTFLVYGLLFATIVFFPTGIRLPRREKPLASATRELGDDPANAPTMPGRAE